MTQSEFESICSRISSRLVFAASRTFLESTPEMDDAFTRILLEEFKPLLVAREQPEMRDP